MARTLAHFWIRTIRYPLLHMDVRMPQMHGCMERPSAIPFMLKEALCN